ncbi:MAG: dienelactone hydrolase family protein [Bdellovibrionales bacterium]|jgi:carboxymethylenebutenolidase|nr:dienelactone hydrolase family protein [Bdellovibrionales bacterium]
MSESITIQAHDGGSFSAYVARPQGAGPFPAVVVIQEIFGVNAVMRGICDDLAKEGFIAICPDLFWRQEPGIQITDRSEEEWKRAFELFNGFDVDLGVEDLKSTLAAARVLEGANGKAGSIGYCLGGKLAYLMATRSDSDANVSYYGVGLDALLGEAPAISKPILLHIAEQDKFVPPDAQKKILDALLNKENITLHVYQGVDHAFARKGGDHYDGAMAETANDRTRRHLKTHLG